MCTNLDGQVAVVTGSGRGIGRSIGRSLAAAGAHVVLAARSLDQLKAVEDEIRADGGEALVVPTDVSDRAQILGLFGVVKDRFGTLDILVNNAGFGAFGPAVSFAVEDFERTMTVNLRGTFLCCQEALKLMIPRRSGYIINVSSVVGIKGYPNQAAYTASKHGIMGLTKSLAVEAQPFGVRISAILPGGVDTDFIGDARPDLDRSVLIRPEDVAKTIMFMLSLSDQAVVDQIYIRRRTSSPF